MKLKKRLPVLLMLAALMIFNINLVVSAHDIAGYGHAGFNLCFGTV